MAQKPPYNLPSAWSPGLAVPDYIRREGLERHAFVTLEAPDGTYDNPAVGSGGFVVPQYVLDEGYGQGAAITKWSPRGSYFGPKIPSFLSNPPNKIVATQPGSNGWTQYTIKSGVPQAPVTPLQGMGDAYMQGTRGGGTRRTAMGDDAMPSAYTQFGHRAASTLIASVQRLAPANRKGALKKALNTIDPSLWSRTQTIASRYTKQGLAPAQALHAGLARAMSTGLAAEIVHTGLKRRKPAAKGLLGLGCYGRRAVALALGDTVVSKADGHTLGTTVALQPIGNPNVGICDASGTKISDVTADGAIFWRALRAGEVCRQSSSILVGSSTGGGNVTVTNADGTVQTAGQGLTQAPPPPDPNAQVLQAGPFSIPLNVAQWSVHWSGKMPADWQAFILPELAHDCSNCGVTSMENATQGHPLGALSQFFDNLPSMVNKDLVGRQMQIVGTGSVGNGRPVGSVSYVLQYPDQPIVLVQRPDNGDQWGVYMSIAPVDVTKPWDSTTNPNTLLLLWKPKPQGVWDWIKIIVGAIVDAVGAALDAVGDLACGLLQSPLGVVGGAAAGASVGGVKGAQAGAAGAQIAAGACGGAAPPVPLPPPTNSWLLPVAIVGMGAAALILLMPKHKKKPGGTQKSATRKTGGQP